MQKRSFFAGKPTTLSIRGLEILIRAQSILSKSITSRVISITTSLLNVTQVDSSA